MDNLFLGIDLGTSSIKFVVQDVKDNYIYQSTLHYYYEIYNDNWTEINPNKWFDIIINELKVIFKYQWSKDIVALALTGQMHTVTFVNKEGYSVRNAILWNDKRTKDDIENIKEQLLQCPTVVHNAQILATGSPLANLLWVRENEPANYEKIHKILIAKDFINYRFTGEFGTDYCDASTTAIYDFSEENWSKEELELFNLPSEIFPKIFHSAKKLGVVLPKIKKLLNIEHDIEVFVGTGDNAATYFASHSLESKDLLISIGTSGVTLIPGNKDSLSDTGKNIAFKLLPEDQDVIVQGSMSTGGKALSWWIEDILKEQDYNEEQDGVNQELIQEAEEIFIPYLSGEKYIYSNSNFKGTFLNITPATSRKKMTLAVLEGISFALKDLSETITHDSYNEIKLIGGGAKSELWKTIFANIFRKNVKDYSSSANAVIGAIKIAKVGYYGVNQQEKIEDIEITRWDKHISNMYKDKYREYLSGVEALNQYYR